MHDLRVHRGLTLYTLRDALQAEGLDVSISTLSRWEAPREWKGNAPPLLAMKALCKVLRATRADLAETS